MSINWKRLLRKVHYWGAIIVALPVLIVIGTGILLQVKPQVPWVQPPTTQGQGTTPMLSFDEILTQAQTVPEAEIKGWDDVNRLDVRPGKGMAKIWAKNNWEIQLDTETGDILQVAYRRSDLIESIHDGSFFHEYAKLWLFLPSAIILFVLWVTGIYLFALPYWSKRKQKERVKAAPPQAVPTFAQKAVSQKNL